MDQKNAMGNQAVWPLLLKMSVPPMISMMIQSLYNIVDSMFVARISEDALTAVSLAFPIQNVIMAAAVGTGVGVNSLIARRLGEKNQEAADSAVTHGLILSLVLGGIFVFVGVFLIHPFFQLFTNKTEVLKQGYMYGSIVTILAVGSCVHILIEKILQATGQMVIPMIMQAFGAIVNIILDPIFIFGMFGLPKLGVAGAAIATIIGQFSAMGLAIYFLCCKKHAIHIQIKGFQFRFSMIKNIYEVGIPSIFTYSLGSILVMGINGILVSFSNVAVAAFGIYYKLQTFIFMPANGLIQGAMPIMGYNYGAGNTKRLWETLKKSIIASVIIMGIGTLLFCAAPVWLLRLFDASDRMLEIGIPALRIISTSYVFAGISFMIATLFQAVGNGLYSLIIALLRQLILILPLAYLLSKAIGLLGIWITFPIAEGIAVVIAGILLVKIDKKIEKRD